MLRRKMLRTALRYKSQFISMILMIMLGVGVFVGFNMEWYSLERDVTAHLEDTGFADYRIYSRSAQTGSMGLDDLFTRDELQSILDIDGVRDATRFLTVNTTVKGDSDIIALAVSENIAVSGFRLIEGEEYDPEDADGLWLSDQYAVKNGMKVGDTMTLTYAELEITGTVRGLIKASEFMICLPEETQLMPDYNSCGFAYIAPAALARVKDTLLKPFGLLLALSGKTADDIDMYFQINVLSDLDKEAFTEAVDAALGSTALIVGKDDTLSYAETQGEINEGKTMGSILPVLFLAIAVLTMVTTMHRITASEKTQIGTLKALGFRDRRILWHYTSYALLIGLTGTAAGVALGYLLGWYILNPDSAMGTYIDLPSWRLYVPPVCWVALAAINGLLTLIGFASVRSMLAGTPADALRPYTPSRVKHMWIEKTRAFRALSFGAKWNLRDIFRHKARSLMTLFGVLGCVILLIGGLGMSDTLNGFVDAFYDEAINYAQRVNLSASDDNAPALALAEELEGDWSASTAVQIGDEAVGLEIYHVTHDKVRFLDENMARVTLSDDGAYICARVARDFGLAVGDEVTFSPYGTDEHYAVTVAGVLRSLSESIVMTDACAEGIGFDYSVNTIYTDQTPQPQSLIVNTQSKQAIMDSFDTFMELMNVMVALLVIGAAVLGIVVLYNLGTMSYVERYREMATLKVVGFRDRRIGQLLISQNLWLTVLGILIGFPAGLGVLQYLLVALASEYEMTLIVTWKTCLISVLITFGVSLLVGLMISRKNSRIDMVAALKTEE